MSATTRAAQLKLNLSGTHTELRDFVASLKGRSPAESMGMVARSRLLRATAISLAAQLLLLLALTLPYAMRPADKPSGDTATQTPTASTATNTTAQSSTASQNTAAPQDTAASAAPTATTAQPPQRTAPSDPTTTAPPRQPSMDTLNLDRLD